MGRQFALLTSTFTFRTLTGLLCPKGIGNSGIKFWMRFETRLFVLVECRCWAYWPRLITLYVHSPLQSWTILTWDRNYNQCQVEHPDKQVDCFILIYVWLLIFLLLLAFFCGLDLGRILAVTCSAILKALCRLWLLMHFRSDSQWRRWRDVPYVFSSLCWQTLHIDKISLWCHTRSTYLQVQRTIMVPGTE